MNPAPVGLPHSSPEVPGRREAVVTGGLGLACGALLIVPGLPAVITAIAAAALVLALPGLAMARALFPMLGLDGAERTAMTLGLSLTLAVLGGLVLDVLPWGLTAAKWGALLGGLTVLFSVVAGWRMRRIVSLGPAAPTALGPVPVPTIEALAPGERRIARRVSGAQAMMLVVATIVAFGSLAVARLGVADQPQPGYTQLWMLGAPSGTQVTVGIGNHEGGHMTYRLTLTIDGNAFRQWDAITVPDGATWEQTVDLPPAGAILRIVDATLFRPTDTAPYREVHVAVRAGPAGASPAGTVTAVPGPAAPATAVP